MVIDIHAHAFPDGLAARAMNELIHTLEGDYLPFSDGTVAGLIEKMDAWGIDVSVIQPVVTKQAQVRGANEWAAAIRSDRLVCFGGIYPHGDSYKEDIDLVVGLGLRGLKFHAEYQDFTLDDPHMLRIYDYALSKGLIILHHAGYDPSFLPPFKTSPRQFRNVIDAMRGGIVIAAHLGGHAQWEDVERYLAGTDIYLDTSMGFEYYPRELFLRIVESHGADKILFGSDAPWSNAKTEIEHLRSLPITENEKKAILGENAKRILALSGLS